MTVIRASCPACNNDFDLEPREVTLAVYEAGPRYAFRCPCCREQCSKPADPKVVKLLAQAGVYAKVTVPRPTVRRPDGPPITLDDLIDLGRELSAL